MSEPIRLGTGILDDAEHTLLGLVEGVYLLSDLLETEVPLIEIIGDWTGYRPRLFEAAEKARNRRPIDQDAIRFVAPVPKPPKLVCVGTNYHDHLREMGITTVPEYPYAFLRPNLCLAGHREKVPLPDWPKFVDWEAELGIVIGKTGRDFKGEEARNAIAGYTIINDISARDWIENRPWVGVDWVMQKAWDRFQPTGPWFTPSEFVADPQALDIQLTVNGTVRQKSNTSEMIFGVDAIVEHLSSIMTLEVGDVIATGTPAGVGFGQKPRISLHKGDKMVVAIEGLGELETTMG